MRRSVVHGSTWIVVGFGTSQLLRLGGNIVLAALLYEEAFALMALAMAIVQGLQMFSDLGIAQSVVQNRRGDDRDFLNTAWTIQCLRGIVLALAATALAWPMAAFYAANDPAANELKLLLPLVALSTLLTGFQSSRLMTAARHIKVGRITSIELAAQATATAVMIAFAWWTKSVYALAIGAVVQAATHCLLSYVAVPGPGNWFRWERKAVSEIISFGKWIFLSTLIFFLALQLDKLIFAKLFPLDQVGVYSIAASLAVLAPTLMGRLQAMIAFPLYSRMLDRSASITELFNKLKKLMLSVGGYLVALVIGGSETFVGFAYDDRYLAAGTYLPILAAGAWFSILEAVYGSAFLATGRARWVAAVNAVKVLAFVLLVVPAGKLWGLIGAIIVIALADLAKAAVAAALARRMGLVDQLSDVGAAAYASVVGVAVLWISREWELVSGLPPIVLLILQFSIITLLFVPQTIRAYRNVASAIFDKPDDQPAEAGHRESTRAQEV
jgi:O-antigen/teichoic acid export membrane protein